MDFSLNDDQMALRDAVQRFCEREYAAPQRGDPESAVLQARRHTDQAILGLLGLPFDSALGGGEQGPVEVMLAAQELGRALAGAGFLANAVLAGPLLAALGTPEQAQRWIVPAVRGDLRLALGHTAGPVRTTARRLGDGWRLDGHKTLVLGGDAADLLLVSAHCEGDAPGALTLFALDATTPGLQRQPLRLLDGRGGAHLRLGGAVAGPERLLGSPGGAGPALELALDRARAALCAESAGALDALLALTCQHLKTRQQFGAPLARLQALQHRVADMAIALEQLKSMACVAALALDVDGDPDATATTERTRRVSAAAHLAARLGRQAALSAIQMHGAMGMTDECRAGHYAKRLIANSLLFGEADFHLQRFAAHRPVEREGDPR